MTRVKTGLVAAKRRKQLMSFTKGFVGAHSKLFRISNQQRMKALKYSYADRKKKKAQLRRIWIARIKAFVTPIRLKFHFKSTYSFARRTSFLNLLINRKIMSHLLLRDTYFGVIMKSLIIASPLLFIFLKMDLTKFKSDDEFDDYLTYLDS